MLFYTGPQFNTLPCRTKSDLTTPNFHRDDGNIKHKLLGITSLSGATLEGKHCGRHCCAMIFHSLWDHKTSEKENYMSSGFTFLNSLEGQFTAHNIKEALRLVP